MTDPARTARVCYFTSVGLFIMFCMLSGGGMAMLIPGVPAEAARIVSSVAGIFAWTLMSVAYSLQLRRTPKAAP